MANRDKLLRQVLRGRSDANIRFADLCNLLRSLGFEERTSSSHHLFVKPGVEELINLQRESGKAKPYQVRQVRKILLRYELGSED